MEATVNYEEILDSSKLEMGQLDRLREAAFASETSFRQLRLLAGGIREGSKLPAPRRIKWAYALHLLGRSGVALEELEEAKAEQDPVGAYVLGNCYLAQDEPGRARKVFEAGLKKDKDNLRLQLAALEADRREAIQSLALDREAADKVVVRLESGLKKARALQKKHPEDAGVLCQVGCALEGLGAYDEAMDTFEEALELDPDHVETLFRLAYAHEQRGGLEVALRYYERIAELAPTYANALVNYGLLLEDLGRYREAVEVYQRIMRARPADPRVRMFLRDAESSLDMYYDEDLEKRSSRRNAILRIPVTDFELSVRARNCLNKMNIRNLGDLVTKTEEELLAYKNFGETSLHEIKQMLAQKGLRLGMFRDGEEVMPGAEGEEEAGEGGSPSDEESLRRPVTEIDLSVRARNCMERLNIRTVGELVAKSEAELLSVKNFGQTSLNEIKQRLAEHGLTLRGS